MQVKNLENLYLIILSKHNCYKTGTVFRKVVTAFFRRWSKIELLERTTLWCNCNVIAKGERPHIWHLSGGGGGFRDYAEMGV